MIITATIKASVAVISDTEATRGMMKLSGSSPRLKVCVTTAMEKKETKRKLIRFAIKAMITSPTRSAFNPVALPIRYAATPKRTCRARSSRKELMKRIFIEPRPFGGRE